ncbi:hypothetical protein PGIGA_G00105450 [Pangasianodon gigas]|uniref:Uncharacterized protein n=1 Tax=Pangasianodon gigas TaxID=30993 RepID=A0ACC5W8F8_PANGG|nr:hypothetical protein [Pangasianodon gigas]
MCHRATGFSSSLNCKSKQTWQLFQDPVESVHFNDAVEAELNSYVITPTIDGEEDPLAWWKQHQVNFPRLSRLACRYLCVPDTSSLSERLFTAAGNIVTCQQSCLKPEKTNSTKTALIPV